MKNLALFLVILVATATVVSAQVSPSRVLKGGERTIIYEMIPGDGIIAIPIKQNQIKSQSGDDGKTSTDRIAVTIYYQSKPTEMSAERQFLPYKLGFDTLWVVIPKNLRERLKNECQNFTGNIPNPTRIEVWNDSKMVGNLSQKHPHTDQGYNYLHMINLHLISLGIQYSEELNGVNGMEYTHQINQYISKENKKIFDTDYFVSKGKI